ncbi:SDR family NAD(P)-dependent oxidoreductase [Thalassolituus oleivorans]|uniref:SDR family NAD(P)-dependent oxidoreductase n=1 Tax=Thalassolituus oleivorans TaxID=187493 RepID=UPI00042DBF9B|nr:SDR family NAD(P)-dependent oxidoreductase [Thalassolituus oleivorans]AHK15563.1 short-chain dehydrogenase [Thalassolituus oleivorans R6-15]
MLKDKKVVIVGGSSGIGLSLAEFLLSQGSEVVIASRSLEKLNTATAKLSGVVTTLQVDASSESSVRELFSQVGDFDHLIVTIKPKHLAGSFQNCSILDARSAFDTKFWGSYNLTRLCLNSISRQGSIILTSGIASKKSYKGFSNTAAINGAVESFVQSVATELAPIRINVSAQTTPPKTHAEIPLNCLQII